MTQAVKLAQLGSPGISTGFKNRIINGAMVIDQRNAGASVTIAGGSNIYTLDRWFAYGSQGSKFSVQQNAGSVTPPNGFTNYLGVTSLSSYSVGTNEAFSINQCIEGYNVADLAWGTANAKTITASFKVRSSLTGTFGGVIRISGTATYPFSYTISSANTWTDVSITIPGYTGTMSNSTTNGAGIFIRFGLGAGSGSSAAAGSWTTVSPDPTSATGATSVVGTNGATFYITGVQLEVGTTATDFEYRDYGRELIMCQRYYEKSFNMASAPGNGAGTTEGTDFSAYYSGGGRTRRFDFKVTKRTAPTITVYGGAPSGGTGVFGYYDFSTWRAFTTTTPESISDSAFRCECTRASSFTNGLTYLLDGNWTASAEL